MENLILFLATSLVLRLPSAKKLKDHNIGNTGCRALLLPHARGFAHTTSEGDKVFLQEFEEAKVGYGIICVQLHEQYCLDEATQMLFNYMEKLKGPFSIVHDLGVHQGEDWNSTQSRSLVDYWQDIENYDWKVKCYTDGRVLSVLYVKNISQATVSRQDHFLDSFHFAA